MSHMNVVNAEKYLPMNLNGDITSISTRGLK